MPLCHTQVPVPVPVLELELELALEGGQGGRAVWRTLALLATGCRRRPRRAEGEAQQWRLTQWTWASMPLLRRLLPLHHHTVPCAAAQLEMPMTWPGQ